MSLNTNIEKFFKIKNNLENKLMTEGLTKNEKVILETVKKEINEAPMTFGQEVGGGRPSRTLQQKIEGGETPLSKIGLTQPQVDFFTSEAFKDSIVRLESLLGQPSGISNRLTIANQNLKTDARNAFSTFMMTVGSLMNELSQLQRANKEELEEIAAESVERAMGIDREFFDKKLKLDGKLTDGTLRALEGMASRAENISDETITNVFADIDAEKKEKLEDLKRDFESDGIPFDEEKLKDAVNSTFQISPQTIQQAKEEFSDEVSRRMIINMFRRGMSLYYANAYKICEDKILELPDGERIIEISNVIQPIMLHMYWIFDDIGGIGSSGGGQIGQVQVLPPNSSNDEDDDEDETPNREEQPRPSREEQPRPSGPFTIVGRAATLPLLVHELVKGVILFFTSAGGKGSQEQRQLTKKAASSLEIEAYDLVYSEKFYIEFYKIFSRLVPNVDEQRELTPFLLQQLSNENKTTLLNLTKSLFTLGLENPEFAEDYIQNLVNKSRGVRKKMEQNPSYMTKKQYNKNTEDETDDDMSWLDDIDF